MLTTSTTIESGSLPPNNAPPACHPSLPPSPIVLRRQNPTTRTLLPRPLEALPPWPHLFVGQSVIKHVPYRPARPAVRSSAETMSR
jgi:hypothetical protein